MKNRWCKRLNPDPKGPSHPGLTRRLGGCKSVHYRRAVVAAASSAAPRRSTALDASSRSGGEDGAAPSRRRGQDGGTEAAVLPIAAYCTARQSTAVPVTNFLFFIFSPINIPYSPYYFHTIPISTLLNFSLNHFQKMDNDDYQQFWDEAFDAVVEEMQREADEEAEWEAAAAVPRPIYPRRIIRRDHAGAHQ